MVMTLCERCLDVFLSDDRYVVTPVYTAACEKGDCECFICCGRGRDYDVDKPLWVKRERRNDGPI